MGKISAIIKRNFSLILRSKSQAFIIFLAPLLIILVIGLAFNSTGGERINVGYFSSENADLADFFIDELRSDNYFISQYQSVNKCNQDISRGVIHICIVFPQDFSLNNSKANEVDFLIDNSKVNYFQSIVNRISEKFNVKAKELSSGLTSELLRKLNQTTGELTSKEDIVNNLITGSNDISSQLTVTNGDLDSIDLSFDPSSYNLEEIDIDLVISDLKSDAFKSIDLALDYIDEMEDIIDDIDDENRINGSIMDDFEDVSNYTEGQLKQFKIDMTSNSKETSDKFDETIDGIQDSLTTLDSQLEYSSNKKGLIQGQISKIKSLNQQNLERVKQIETTFKAISSNIESTEITNLDVIVQPIKHNIVSVVNEDSQLNFFFPYLIILIIAFIGLMLTSSLVIMDKLSPAHFRNFVTPTRDTVFLVGTYLTSFIVILFQVTILITIYAFYFQKNIVSNLPTTLIILFLSSTIFILFGMLIGNFLRSEETNMLSSISLISIMIFVSNLIFPLEKMPENVAMFTQQYNPFYICSDLLRKAMVHKMNYSLMLESLFPIILAIPILYCFVGLSYKLSKKHVILRFSGYLARRDARKLIRQADYMEIHKKISELKKSQFFKIDDEHAIHNLEELTQYISKLEKKKFKEYVNNDKNLFADWIHNEIEHEPLAAALYKTTSKRKTVKLLTKEIKLIHKYLKKETSHS